MQKTRFVLIGCGRVAKRHLDAIRVSGELVTVCDSNETIVQELSVQYQVPYYTTIQELISQHLSIDVAVICTPNGLHAEQAIYFLENGIHVLVEKPIALSVADAERMIATAEKYDRHVFTVLQNRFNPPVHALQQAIEHGELGKLFSVQVNCFWHRDQRYYSQHLWHGKADLDGGILFTQFSHFIDLLLWCFGPVKEVAAILHNTNHSYTELSADEGAVLLHFENGMIGTLQFSVNAYQQNMEGSITLLAEKGTVKIGGPYLNSIVYQEMQKPISVNTTENTVPLHQVYQSLIRTLQLGEKFYADARESLATIQLIERIHTIAQLK